MVLLLLLLLLLWPNNGDPGRARPWSIKVNRRNKHNVHHHDTAAAALSMPTAAAAKIDAADETRIRVVVILVSSCLSSSLSRNLPPRGKILTPISGFLLPGSFFPTNKRDNNDDDEKHAE